MKRIQHSPRKNWQSIVESQGLTYHTHETTPYWNESAYYSFTSSEIDTLEKSTNTLHKLFVDAAQNVIDNNRWDELCIPKIAQKVILASWEKDEPGLYGRFDLAYDGKSSPKLLEYNADTPTSLIEAAIAQWFWLKDEFPKKDQFNSLHERLIDAWKYLKLPQVNFTGIQNNLEDNQTIAYLMDTCLQSGTKAEWIALGDIGHIPGKGFVDLKNKPIDSLFKLYPWEWLWHEAFSVYIPEVKTSFIEPPWKMLFSNKAMLPILWELFPDHPNLLPAYTTEEKLAPSYARKPILSREGANVTLVKNGSMVASTEGTYGKEGYIYQGLAPVPNFDNNYPILGAWIVQGEAAGMGIREDSSLITGNLSRFVPHLIED